MEIKSGNLFLFNGWWIDSIKEINPEIYSDVTLHHPPSIFVDRTHDRETWENDVESYLLARLSSSLSLIHI